MLFVVFLMLQIIDFLVFFEKKLFREVLLIFDLLIYLHVVIVIHFCSLSGACINFESQIGKLGSMCLFLMIV